MRPEAREVVALAKAAGLVVAVLTNDMRAFHGDAWIARMTILGEMDLVVDGSVEHVLKPDPRIYRLATERLGVEPEDCLFVDDQPGNVEGAGPSGWRGSGSTSQRPRRSSTPRSSRRSPPPATRPGTHRCDARPLRPVGEHAGRRVWSDATVTMRIAVVGAGPSGLYAADALSTAGVQVDVLDRLPVPFGLVRYGVAPDHHSIRSVRDTLGEVLEKPEVRPLGSVEVGLDVTVAELVEAYDAVVLTYGAARDRRLDVPGEDLPGSVAATDFVAWYCGHPDADREGMEAALAAARSVVVGCGQCRGRRHPGAHRAARGLQAPTCRSTSWRRWRRSTINDVHVLGRRGPAQATWTTKELEELGRSPDVDIVIGDR